MYGQVYQINDMGNIEAHWFPVALLKAGRFDVMQRPLLQEIIHEQRLGLTADSPNDRATQNRAIQRYSPSTDSNNSL